MPGEHVLVTGGTGFLGSAIVQAFLERHPEFQYTVLDIRPSLTWKPPRDDIRCVQADVRDGSALTEAIKSAAPTVIVHAAGVVPAGAERYSQRCRNAVFEINVGGTKNMLDAARKSGVKVFVYTSSATVVGDDLDHDYPNVDETVPIGHAQLVYGQSKTAAERLVLAANSSPPHSSNNPSNSAPPPPPSAFLTCALRPSVLFGPGDAQLVPAIHGLIAARQTPFVIGPGTNLYDFTYVTNAADAHVLAVENLLLHHQTSSCSSPSNQTTCSSYSPAAAGQAIFISNDAPVPFRDFCRAVWARFGHVPALELRVPAGAAKALGGAADALAWATGREFALCGGSVRDALGTRYASGRRAREVLGYAPRVGLAEGVRRACEDYEMVLAEREEAERRRRR